MSETANGPGATGAPSLILAETRLAAYVRDIQTGEVPALARSYIAEVGEEDLEAYQISGDRTALLWNMTPAFRQDVDCAIAATDAIRFARVIAGAEIGTGDTTAVIGRWRAGAAQSQMNDLGHLLTAVRSSTDAQTRAPRFIPVSNATEADVEAVSGLIGFINGMTQTEVRPHWSALQQRSIVLRANTVAFNRLDELQTTLIGDLAAACKVEDDPVDNLEFWTGLVSDAADVLAEDREAKTRHEPVTPVVQYLGRQALVA